MKQFALVFAVLVAACSPQSPSSSSSSPSSFVGPWTAPVCPDGRAGVPIQWMRIGNNPMGAPILWYCT